MIKLATERGIEQGIERGRIAGREEGLKDGLKKGRASGLKEGRMEGLEQGQRQASIDLLLDLLQAKFGTLPDWARQRLEAASVTTLRQLSMAVLRAPTIDEVFGGESDHRI